MTATLKLIQQVTSSILDKKAVSISKATPHITRIAKKKLVVPKSAIKGSAFLKPNILIRKPAETSIDEADEDAEEEEEDPEIVREREERARLEAEEQELLEENKELREQMQKLNVQINEVITQQTEQPKKEPKLNPMESARQSKQLLYLQKKATMKPQLGILRSNSIMNFKEVRSKIATQIAAFQFIYGSPSKRIVFKFNEPL